MDTDTKKNLLNLQYQKYLTTAATSAVIGFTYLIGMGLAIITKQVNFKNPASWFLFLIFSTFFISLITIIFFKALYHMKNILELIKNV